MLGGFFSGRGRGGKLFMISWRLVRMGMGRGGSVFVLLLLLPGRVSVLCYVVGDVLPGVRLLMAGLLAEAVDFPSRKPGYVSFCASPHALARVCLGGRRSWLGRPARDGSALPMSRLGR